MGLMNMLGKGAKAVADDVGKYIPQNITDNALDFVDTTVDATKKAAGEVAEFVSPNMLTQAVKNKNTGISTADALKNTWDTSTAFDKGELALTFTPWGMVTKGGKTALKGINKIGEPAMKALVESYKAGTLADPKQIKAVETFFEKNKELIFKGAASKADELPAQLDSVDFNKLKEIKKAAESGDQLAVEKLKEITKLLPKTDNVVSSKADELAEAGVDWGNKVDDAADTADIKAERLKKAGFNPEGAKQKVAIETVETTVESTPTKLDLAKIKGQGSGNTTKELEIAASEIKDPIVKAKVEEAIKKNPNKFIEWLKNNKVGKAWAEANPSMKAIIGGAATLGTAAGIVNSLSSTDSDQKEINNISNESKTPPMSKAPSETTPNQTPQTQAPSETPLTLETTKLPGGKLPHQVVSQEMGLSWQKNRDKIDAGLAELGLDLSKVGPVGSSARNIAMANYIVQLKAKSPAKFEKLQNSISNIEV